MTAFTSNPHPHIHNLDFDYCLNQSIEEYDISK